MGERGQRAGRIREKCNLEKVKDRDNKEGSRVEGNAQRSLWTRMEGKRIRTEAKERRGKEDG